MLPSCRAARSEAEAPLPARFGFRDKMPKSIHTARPENTPLRFARYNCDNAKIKHHILRHANKVIFSYFIKGAKPATCRKMMDYWRDVV
jgi:hypothetical protein